MTMADELPKLLREHWITGHGCDEALPKHTDRTRVHCWCGWSSKHWATTGEALDEWIGHIPRALSAAPPAMARPSGAEVLRLFLRHTEECAKQKLDDILARRMPDCVCGLDDAIAALAGAEAVYLAAVKGRQDFRAAYREALTACRDARAHLEKGRALWNGPCHQAAKVLDDFLTRRAAPQAEKGVRV